MDFRIGINLGDVVHRENRIYGDGVNIAARIESLADPGGICISRGVFDQVKRKVRNGFEYLGEHAVKNIPEPVRIYRILLAPEDKGKVIGESMNQPTLIKTNNIKAYEKYLIGYEHEQRRTEADTQQARKLAQESISLDPGYGAPYLLLDRTYLDDVWYYKSKIPRNP